MKIQLKKVERSISNAQGEFEILDGVCGEIVLQLVTQMEKSIRENMIVSIYHKYRTEL